MQSSQSAWGFIIDPTVAVQSGATCNGGDGAEGQGSRGNPDGLSSKAAPKAQDSRATERKGTGRRRQRKRKMRGNP